MMRKETQEVTCIICPVGCRARVVLRSGRVLAVKNVECSRGKAYATNEVKAPVRDFFTTVRLEGARNRVLPVRTTAPVPKNRVMDCALELSKITVKSPVKAGDVVVRNLLGLGVDVITTRDLQSCRTA